MAPKKSKRDSKKKKQAKIAPGTKGPDLTQGEPSDEQVDYGGLPNRNLKKNIGC